MLNFKHIPSKNLTKGKDRTNKSDYDFINESINFNLQCIFIAIPKTGSTSVRRQIRQRGIPWIPSPHLNIMQARDLIYPHLLRSSLKTNLTFPSRNIPTDKDIRSQSRQIFEKFFKFSAVRNPWARAASLYFRNETIQVREKITFEYFCENHFFASDTCRHPTLHKNQLDWLVDENETLAMDYIYKVEEFNTIIKEISRRTNGRVKLKDKVLNRNQDSQSSNYRDLYSKRSKKIISERFAKDIDTFKYTF